MAAEQLPREPGTQRKGRPLACVTPKELLHGELWLPWYGDDTQLTVLGGAVLASRRKTPRAQGARKESPSPKGSSGGCSKTGVLPSNKHPFVELFLVPQRRQETQGHAPQLATEQLNPSPGARKQVFSCPTNSSHQNC